MESVTVTNNVITTPVFHRTYLNYSENNGITQDYYVYDNYTNFDHVCNRYHNFLIFQNVINVLLVVILILFGWIGNTLAIIVLRSDSTNKTVNFLLQALAVADNLYLLTCLFTQTIRAINQSTDWIIKYAYFERYAWAFAAMAQTAAVWIVVLVTTDRYIAICHPFKVSCLCTLPRAVAMLISIVVIAILYNLPRFFEHTVELGIDLCTNKERYMARHSAFRKDRVYFIVYKTGFYLVFRLFIPLVTLFVLNTKLILVLKNATKNHASLTKTDPKKDSFTIVLVTVVSVFLICELPDAIIRILRTIAHFTTFQMDGITLSYANTISNMLLTVNSSVNCLIYSITGKMFRKRLRRLCSHQRRNNSAHVPYYYQYSEDRNSAGAGAAYLMNKSHHHAIAAGRRGCNGTATEVNTATSLLKDTSM